MRVVFDTNTVVSALLFPRGRLGWLRDAWRSRQVVPVVFRATIEETLRVFAYPKFNLSPGDRDEVLADYLPFAESFEPDTSAPESPACRDPDDPKFLALAIASGADALVTGDDDRLTLAKFCAVPILSPTELRARVGLQQG